MTAPSCTFTLLPIRMLFTSPRMTALNQKLHSLPVTTSPTIVALGAIKQLSPNFGYTPSTGKMSGIKLFFNLLANTCARYGYENIISATRGPNFGCAPGVEYQKGKRQQAY